MMRKIIANMLISLDGVVEEPGSRHFPYFNDETAAAVDAVLGDARRIVVSHERPELTWRAPSTGLLDLQGGRVLRAAARPTGSGTPSKGDKP
jgi:hypothetical protein